MFFSIRTSQSTGRGRRREGVAFRDITRIKAYEREKKKKEKKKKAHWRSPTPLFHSFSYSFLKRREKGVTICW